MGDKQGYAIPADKNPNNLPAELVFPWDQAAYLVNFAEDLGFGSHVRTRVDNIRKMLGDPNAVSTVLTAWQHAVSDLTRAIDGSAEDGIGLESSNENLKARWNGTSRDAAVEYVGRLITVTRNNRTAISDMATSLNNIGAKVSNAYSQAIVHISNTAESLLQYEAARQKMWQNIVGVLTGSGLSDTANARSNATEAVATFMSETGKIAQSVENYMTDVGGEVDQIITKIGEVEVPAAISFAALDISGWQPRNPTGPSWGTPT
ncbi:hypothetical protein IU474_01560 [Nocardia otitidiscaviarum]|uniref:hypothetical protein n=1 Tax=Nocardia otitidiscaviarum TaxID=1823 RepID=UPI001895BEFF|nr:hypothetical protein [Nocardia otitidiscaviarum]MBF6235768.1 hypothetical protein [Nocardia otitidiscaviarum]